MNRDSKKIELAQQLLQTEDETKLLLVEAVLSGDFPANTIIHKSDAWENLPQNIRNGINRALEQIQTEKGKPHQVVMEKARAKYGLA